MNGALLSSLQNGLLGGKYGRWKKAFLVLLMAALVVSVWGGITRVNAASVGDQLPTPEAGWQRFDAEGAFFQYDGNWVAGSDGNCYNSTHHQATAIGSTVNFKFQGTKLRIISATYTYYPDQIDIYIDGVKSTFSVVGTSPVSFKNLVFEKTGLSLGTHTVQIIQQSLVSSSIGFIMDAIDIDDTGSLVDPNAPTIDAPLNLLASPGNAQVNLSWDAVTGADTYNIKRSETPGGPYTSIATGVTGATYNDTSVVNGTTYYYVVTAVNTSGESNPSNEVSATPQAPPASAGQALLVITMVNGLEKEYDLTMTEVNAFINWYDNRADGTGPERYEIEKDFNKGPFTSRKDNLVFDKIMTFEVMEYNAVQ